MGGCGCCCSCTCVPCCRPTVFCGPLSNAKTRDFINIYHEEIMRMHCYYQILRTTPQIPRRPREPVPLPVPVKQRQPSKRHRIPPYTYLFPGEIVAEVTPHHKKHGKKHVEIKPLKPTDFCARI